MRRLLLCLLAVTAACTEFSSDPVDAGPNPYDIVIPWQPGVAASDPAVRWAMTQINSDDAEVLRDFLRIHASGHGSENGVGPNVTIRMGIERERQHRRNDASERRRKGITPE